MSVSNAITHEIVYFTGHVQGVGFRYTTFQVSKEFEVTGFVQNLADGRVHLEVEGTLPAVNGFIKEVEERMEGFVRKTERVTQVRAPVFKEFSIR